MIRRFTTRYERLQRRLPENLRTAPVAAALVPVALVLAFVWAWGAAQSASQIMETEVSVLSRRVAIARDAEPEAVWRARHEQAQTARAAIADQVVWSGDTAGVVAARIQSAVAGLVQAAGLERGRVRVSEEPVSLDGVSFHEVVVEGGFEPAALGQLVDGLERHRPLLRIAAIDATSQRPATVRIVIYAAVGGES